MARACKASLIDRVLPLQFRDQVARNQIAYLLKHGMLIPRWPGRCALRGAGRLAASLGTFIFHACRLQAKPPPGQHFFKIAPYSLENDLWDGSESKTISSDCFYWWNHMHL